MVLVIMVIIKPANTIADVCAWLTNDSSFCDENSDKSRTNVIGVSSELQLETRHLPAIEKHAGRHINSLHSVKAFHRAQVNRTYGKEKEQFHSYFFVM